MPRKTKSKTRISRITVARLYNLVNYEHVRYEITADVADGESAAAALIELKRIIASLKPIKKPYRLDSYRELLKKDEREQSEAEKAEFKEASETVGVYESLRARQWEAVKLLDEVGGVSVRKDARDNWQDDDDESF